jgi:hypothetical protein
MFVLTLADGLCCAWFIYPVLCWCWCSEIGTNSIDWAQLSRIHLKTKTESYLRKVVCFKKNRTMDNTQKYINCINIPSSQTLRSRFTIVYCIYSYAVTYTCYVKLTFCVPKFHTSLCLWLLCCVLQQISQTEVALFEYILPQTVQEHVLTD